MEDAKERKNLLNIYISLAKIFFFIAICIGLFYLFFSVTVLPDERDAASTECRIFESQWERILEDGERVSAKVPGKVEAKWGEVVVLATTLPKKLYNGEYLCFRPIWQDVEVYVDGQLRESYNTEATRPFGANSVTRYVFVELNEEDAGKELTYHFSSKSKYAGTMQECLIGDRMSIWMYLLHRSGVRTAIFALLILLSLFCIVVCLILRIAYKRVLVGNYLAWTLFFCALWMLSESEFRQLIFKNVSAVANIAYWSLMLIPFPFIIYINDVQRGRYKQVYILPLAYSAAMLVIGTILQVFDIIQFVQQIPFIHAGLITAMAALIGTITIDAFKRKLSEYLWVGIGVYGMLLTAILEMALYYVGVSNSLGTILGAGLLFLLIMAIIKTGQDLFSTEKKKQQAVAAREAQAKFLASMSHEIRTPINVIIGMNEMILRENDNSAVNDFAYNIKNASNMLLGLINDVLDFSKIESGQLELVENTYNLASLIQDEILLLKARSAEKPLSTLIDIDSRLPLRLWGDELRIKQVLTNLLSNAVKYTKEGSVTLKAYYTPIDEVSLNLCFSVKDTGIGIKEEDKEKLFDSFKRLDLEKNRTIQGTGLGLNIVKQLVEQMQGNITVDSEYGKGSVFTVSIPQKIMDRQPIGSLEDSIQESRRDEQAVRGLFTAPEARVLIVDDNPVNLSLVKGLLKRTQIKVDLAKSGEQSLVFTRKKKYDVIFMDHMMPELDGVETLRKLRAEETNPNKDGIVIALTANAIAGCREMYLDYGFNDYFSKPIQADKLEWMLLQYLPEDKCKRKVGDVAL